MDQALQQVMRSVEAELEAPPQSYAQPHHRLPEGVAHAEGVNELGRLTAEATMNQYRDMVTAIEAMGREFDVVDGFCDKIKQQTADARKQLTELAASYHERGKQAFEMLQRESLRLDEDKKAIEGMAQRLASIT